MFEEKTLESNYIYKGAILNLRKDKVTVASGQSYREIVEHNGGAAVAAITNQGQIVLVRQYRKAFEDYILEVPAGKVEKGEDPYQTINRELREETGFTAGKITHLTKMLPSVGYTQEVVEIYLATDLTPGETDFDENESLEIVFMDFKEAVNMVMTGQITDAKTIIAILFTKHLMED